MYGTQTKQSWHRLESRFENDVKMYGTQTYVHTPHTSPQFENDVKMYGTQTFRMQGIHPKGLRMM